MGRKSNTKVWEYFDYISDRSAQCQTCKVKITTPRNGTYNLKRHLFTMHGINTYLTGTYKDKTTEKSDTVKGRWKFKRIRFDAKERRSKNCENSNQTSIHEKVVGYSYNDDSILNGSNGNSMEEEGSRSHLSSAPPLKQYVPDSKRFEIDQEDDYEDVKNIQNDTSAKSNLAISSVYTTSNPLINSPLLSAGNSPLENRIDLEKLKTEALIAKLKAEARYFTELADLTRSKRIYVNLQCQQLQKQFKKT